MNLIEADTDQNSDAVDQALNESPTDGHEAEMVQINTVDQVSNEARSDEID